VRNQRRRVCADERGRRDGRNDRDADCLHRRPTRRTGNRRANQDRTRRSLAGAGRWPGRLSAHRCRADEPVGFISHDSGVVQSL
jgi:hypothetical protein